jgi:hypothetical protein
MIRERLSGPPGVNRKSGRTIRSLIQSMERAGSSYKLSYSIGGPIAPYANKHEESGAIGFRTTFASSMIEVVENIRIGLQFLARNVGVGGDMSRFIPDAPPVDEGLLVLQAVSTQRRFYSKTKSGHLKRSSYKNLRPSSELKAEAIRSLNIASVTVPGAGPIDARRYQAGMLGLKTFFKNREGMMAERRARRKALNSYTPKRAPKFARKTF